MTEQAEIYDLIRNLVTHNSEAMTWWPSLAEREHEDRKIRSHP